MPQPATPTHRAAARRRASRLLGLALVLLALALALPAGASALIPRGSGGDGWVKQVSGTTATLFALAFPTTPPKAGRRAAVPSSPPRTAASLRRHAGRRLRQALRHEAHHMTIPVAQASVNHEWGARRMHKRQRSRGRARRPRAAAATPAAPARGSAKGEDTP